MDKNIHRPVFLKAGALAIGLLTPFFLIPALSKATTHAGLLRKQYPGNFDGVPQFEQREPSKQCEVNGLDAAPGSQQFVGCLRVPMSGVYQFALLTNGKAVVRLHDALLIDADSQNTAGTKTLSGPITLQAGLHPLRTNYLATTDAATVSLEWQD